MNTENYKTALKKVKEDLNELKDTPCSWNESFNIKMTTFPKLIHRFSAISIKIPAVLIEEIHELILKFIWKCKLPK